MNWTGYGMEQLQHPSSDFPERPDNALKEMAERMEAARKKAARDSICEAEK